MTFYDLAEALLQGFQVQRTAQTHRNGNVIGRVAGCPLIKKPQPLLIKRQRGLAPVFYDLDGASCTRMSPFFDLPLQCGQLFRREPGYALNEFFQRMLLRSLDLVYLCLLSDWRISSPGGFSTTDNALLSSVSRDSAAAPPLISSAKWRAIASSVGKSQNSVAGSS